MSSGNRIHQLLADAGIDWRQPIGAFIERYGVTMCPWLEIDIVLVGEGAPFLHGLMRPLEFHLAPQWALNQPPLEFFGLVSVASDWATNFDAAHDELAARLGTAPSDDNANSRGRRWRDGDAEIEIRSWPPELQFPSVNYMHQREPRTKTACHVAIATGYRPECTPTERALLNGFAEIAALPEGARNIALSPRQFELEYFRVLPSDLGDLEGRIGLAGDRLVWARTNLHVVPIEEVKRVTLVHCHPARGPGQGGVELLCGSSAAGGHEKSLGLGVHRFANGLDDWAETLANRLDRPLAILETYDE